MSLQLGFGLAIGLLVLFGFVLWRVFNAGQKVERGKSAEAALDVAEKQKNVPHPLPGETESKLTKGDF